VPANFPRKMESDSDDGEYVTFRGKSISKKGHKLLQMDKVRKYPWLTYKGAWDSYAHDKFHKAKKRNLIGTSYYVKEHPMSDFRYTKHKENKHNQKARASRRDYLYKVQRGILKPFKPKFTKRRELTLQMRNQIGANRLAAKAKLKAKKKIFKQQKYAYAKNRVY